MTLALIWAGTAAIAAGLCYRWRDRAIAVCGVIVLASASWALAFLITGQSSTYFFEDTAARFIGTVIVGIVSAVGVIHILPRVHGDHAGRSCLTLCLIVAALYAALGLSLWRAADDALNLSTLPEASTRAEVLARYAEPASERIYGILVPGRFGELANSSSSQVNKSPAMFLECRDGLGLGASGDAFFPSSFTVTLADGSTATAQGITSVKQAEGWPRTERRMDECGLRDGDPVVIWGDPGTTRKFGSDQLNPAINAVRIIAYGGIDSFRDTLGQVAERTGRATLALASLNGGLAIAAVAFGVATYRRREAEKNTATQ